METLKIITQVRKRYKLQQVVTEWQWFLDKARDLSPKVILEIGFAAGASSLCLSHFTQTLISVDIKKMKNKPVLSDIKENCDHRYLKVNSKTEECLKAIEHVLGGREIDVLFIDGDHTYKSASRDFEKYRHLVREGGIIGLHDIVSSAYHKKANCHVYKLWEEIKTKYETEEMTCTKWGGIGIVKYTK